MLLMSRFFRRICIVLLIGCSESTSESTSGPSGEATRTPSLIQVGDTAVTLDDGGATQLSAIIRDQNGQPFSVPPTGFVPSWSSADVSIASVSQTGRVQAIRPGRTQIRVEAGNLLAFVNVTVRIVPSALILVGSNPTHGTVGTALHSPVVVQVNDRHANPVAGVIVRFTSPQGGAFRPESIATDAQGLAQAVWTLGTTAGVKTATVTSPSVGTTALTLSVRAVPGPAATIEVSPATSRVIRNKRVQLSARAFDRYRNEIESQPLQWLSSDPRISTVSASGLVHTIADGEVKISARLGDAQSTATIEAFSVQNEIVSAFLATPAAGHLWEVPVLAIAYLPTADGDTIDVAHAPDYWSLNPISLDQIRQSINTYHHRIKFALEERSRFRGYKDVNARPSLGYRVVAQITVYEPLPPGARVQVGQQWIHYPDYHSIFTRLDVKRYVEQLGVKEIWLWQYDTRPTDPSFDSRIHRLENVRGLWESNMASPTSGDVSNSNRDPNDMPVYNATYLLYGYNFRRTQAEALHNHGHQLEAQFSYVNWRQDGNLDLFWRRFVGQEGPGIQWSGNFITGRAGWTHMPPNTTSHYDYSNSAIVSSDIEDWGPDHTGARTMVSAGTWANKSYPWPGGSGFINKGETQYYVYWMQNMPGRENGILQGQYRMTNWWEFVGDWDGAMRRGLGLHTGPFSPGGRSALRIHKYVEPPPKK